MEFRSACTACARAALLARQAKVLPCTRCLARARASMPLQPLLPPLLLPQILWYIINPGWPSPVCMRAFVCQICVQNELISAAFMRARSSEWMCTFRTMTATTTSTITVQVQSAAAQSGGAYATSKSARPVRIESSGALLESLELFSVLYRVSTRSDQTAICVCAVSSHRSLLLTAYKTVSALLQLRETSHCVHACIRTRETLCIAMRLRALCARKRLWRQMQLYVYTYTYLHTTHYRNDAARRCVCLSCCVFSGELAALLFNSYRYDRRR